MKKVIVAVVLVTVVMIGIGIVNDLIAIRQLDEGWYDEETRIGWNPRDEFYWVMEDANDFTKEEREQYKLADNYKSRLTHLNEDMRKLIIQNYLDNR